MDDRKVLREAVREAVMEARARIGGWIIRLGMRVMAEPAPADLEWGGLETRVSNPEDKVDEFAKDIGQQATKYLMERMGEAVEEEKRRVKEAVRVTPHLGLSEETLRMQKELAPQPPPNERQREEAPLRGSVEARRQAGEET